MMDPTQNQKPGDQLSLPAKPLTAKPELPAVIDLVIPEEWGVNTPVRKEQLKRSRSARNVKHGLLTAIPMICRDMDCPYKAHCVFQQRGEVTKGERCVLEIGKLMEASEQYYNEFGVDPTDPGQRTDAVLIMQLLNLEILIDRCNMLLATGNLVEEIDVAISPAGDVIQQPQLHKAAEALPKLQRRQNEILQLLMATRKDKVAAASSIGIGIDQWTKLILDRAAMVEARLEHMRKGETIEAEKIGVQYSIEAHEIEMEEEDKDIDKG